MFQKNVKIIIAIFVAVSIITIAIVTGIELGKTDNTQKVYAEYRDKIQGWLVKNVQNGNSYIINLSIFSEYEVPGKNEVTKKSAARKYRITVSRAERTAKIELDGSEVFNPALAKIAFGEGLDKAAFVDLKNDTSSIYLPQGGSYKKYIYENKEFKRAVDALLFPDNINIPLDSIIASGNSYANGVKAFEDIQVTIDSAPFYKPLYILSGAQQKEQAALSVVMSYSLAYNRLSTLRVRESGTWTLNLVNMAYKTITGEDYAKTYEGMNLMEEMISVDIIPDYNQTRFELPKV